MISKKQDFDSVQKRKVKAKICSWKDVFFRRGAWKNILRREKLNTVGVLCNLSRDAAM